MLGCENPSFVVMGLDFHAVAYVDRFDFAEGRGPGITFSLWRVPKNMVSGEAEVDLGGVGPRLLKAEDVRLLLCHEIQETLPEDRTNAVDVPGNELQAGRSSSTI